MFPKDYFRKKSIRDPLYGFIDLSEIETKLVDTNVFRRLHSIKQLSHAFVVYPSAIHTRLEHSLGCLHIANKMSHELGLTDEERENVRIAALLHDIGHGPFSHLFEHVLQKINPDISKPHELITSIIINEDKELGSILDSKKDIITKLLNPEKIPLLSDSKTTLLSDIVTSGLDADKLDYLRRDSYHIGVAYGQFDLDRILHTIQKTPDKQSRICIDIKGKDALENYRLGRYLMHAQVYEHHARLAADQMFLQALDIAIEQENVIDKDLLILKKDSNEKFLDFYLSLDDNSIYDLIINNDKSKVSKEILINIKKRKLLKRACEFTPHDLAGHANIGNDLKLMDKKNLLSITNEIAQDLGLSSHEIIFHKSEISIKLFKGEILFLKNNQVFTLQGASPISAKDSVVQFYVFGPHDLSIREKIARKVAEKLSVSVEKISQFKEITPSGP